MTRDPSSTRRGVLTATGGAALVALAGCLGLRTGASTPSPTAEQHHDEDEHHAETTTEHREEDGHHEESATDHHEEEDHHEHSPTEHESGHGHSHDEGVTPASDAATVRMTTTDAGQHFEPHVTWVNPGGSVTFVNESGSHSATAYHPDNDRPLLMPEDAEPFDSGLLTESGAEFEQTFDTVGVYHIFCKPHEAVGMLGSVIVGEPEH